MKYLFLSILFTMFSFSSDDKALIDVVVKDKSIGKIEVTYYSEPMTVDLTDVIGELRGKNKGLKNRVKKLEDRVKDLEKLIKD